MYKLIGIAPRDGWGLAVREGKFYVLRPPYDWPRCREEQDERYIANLVGKRMYFIGCDQDFETFEDVIEHLKAEYVKICKKIMGDRPRITEEEAKDLAKWLRSRKVIKIEKA